MNIGIKFPITGDYTNDDVIENTLKYIFSYPTELNPERKPKTIHFYGIPYIGYPPKIEDLILQFKLVRCRQSQTIPQQVWHFLINFSIPFNFIYGQYFYFADAVAACFSTCYPVAYAYHTENKTTGNHHSHFHYIVSTSSYLSNTPALGPERMIQYLFYMQTIAQQYGLSLYLQQSQEELECLNLMKIY